jgi:hypothetical protein
MCKAHLGLLPEEETSSNDSEVVDEVADVTVPDQVVDDVVEETTSDDCVCDICGDYLNTNAIGVGAWVEPNDWHYVTISQVDNCELLWTNDAGASWGMDYDAAAGVLTTQENCPWGVFELTVDDDGVIMNTSGEGAL